MLYLKQKFNVAKEMLSPILKTEEMIEAAIVIGLLDRQNTFVNHEEIETELVKWLR